MLGMPEAKCHKCGRQFLTDKPRQWPVCPLCGEPKLADMIGMRGMQTKVVELFLRAGCEAIEWLLVWAWWLLVRLPYAPIRLVRWMADRIIPSPDRDDIY